MIRESHVTGDTRVQDPYCIRCQPQVTGAAMDVLRQAARTLEIEAKMPGGFPEHVVRTVTENGRSLKFTNQGFESE